MLRLLCLLAFFAVSCEAFVAPASPALSRSVVSVPAVQMFSGSSSAKAKPAKSTPLETSMPVGPLSSLLLSQEAMVRLIVRAEAAKKVAKKVVKKVVKKPVKKVVKKTVAKKGEFKPGQQMKPSQAVSELLGGFGNAFSILKDLPNN